MEVKTVYFLYVLACAMLISRVMPFPAQGGGEALDVAQGETALDALTGSEGDEDAMDRNRRIVGGFPRKIGDIYRGRPRPSIYRTRWGPGSRTGGGRGYSPY